MLQRIPNKPNDLCQRFMRPAPVIDALARHPLLQGLNPMALQAMAQGASLQRLRSGATAFHEGDEAGCCLLVETGAVEVLRYSDEGDERVFHCFMPGQLVAEAAMFMPHGRYPMTARAVGTTQAWRLPRTSLRAACEQFPPLAMRLLESFSLRLYKRINEVEWLTASNAQQRLAAYLLGLGRQQGSEVALPVSQRQLAAHLGVRAETLNRVLADWQGRGWIAGERRRWRIDAPAALQDMAGASVRTF